MVDDGPSNVDETGKATPLFPEWGSRASSDVLCVRGPQQQRLTLGDSMLGEHLPAEWIGLSCPQSGESMPSGGIFVKVVRANPLSSLVVSV